MKLLELKKENNEYIRFFVKRFPLDQLEEILKTHVENERYEFIKKEITEVVGMYFFIKKFLKDIKTLADCCAGYLLFSNFIARLHPEIKIYAIDVKELKKEQKLIFYENVEFLKKDIREIKINVDAAIGIHPCNELSEIIIEKFKNSKLIALMPCCIGSINFDNWKRNNFEYFFLSNITNEYIAWSYYLAKKLEAQNRKVLVKRDYKILSERNILIAGVRQF